MWSVNRLLNWADETDLYRPNTKINEITAAEMRELADHIKGLQDKLSSALDRLETRSTLLAEIVAWFDVAQQRWDLYDGTVVDEWPTDWLRRARERDVEISGLKSNAD